MLFFNVYISKQISHRESRFDSNKDFSSAFKLKNVGVAENAIIWFCISFCRGKVYKGEEGISGCIVIIIKCQSLVH